MVGAGNGDTVLKVNVKEDEKLSFGSYSPADQFTRSKTDHKTFVLGKFLLPKKYIPFANGYKPSKYYKKAWNNYKAYLRYFIKAAKKLKRHYKILVYKLALNHWHLYDYDVKYQIKYTNRYAVIKYYCLGYRTYNYNPLLKKAWWD